MLLLSFKGQINCLAKLWLLRDPSKLFPRELHCEKGNISGLWTKEGKWVKKVDSIDWENLLYIIIVFNFLPSKPGFDQEDDDEEKEEDPEGDDDCCPFQRYLPSQEDH